MENETQTCRVCNETKPLTEFCADKRELSGRNKRCKKCFNLYRKGKYCAKVVEPKSAALMRSYFARKLENMIDQDAKKFPNYKSDLTIDILINIYNNAGGRCTYSGEKLFAYGTKSVFNTVSFDRIDNNLPHCKENLQLTSIYFNRLRGDLLHEEFAKYWKYY